MKYGEVNLGQVEAVINKLGGIEGWNALLRNELEIKSKPLPFPKNEHGHYIIEVTGLNLTGAQEITRLESLGFLVSDCAESILISTNPDSYDANHRLEDGQVYKVAIVPGREMKSNRTTANLQTYGSQFGYTKPLAGIQPRIREAVSDKQLEEMGIYYIVSLHEVIKNSDGDPLVLSSDRDVDGQWILASLDHPVSRWNDDGAFAFLVHE
ncbi:MAG: hypothetical protein ACSLEX_00150 [Minisyncoccota bacterium]